VNVSQMCFILVNGRELTAKRNCIYLGICDQDTVATSTTKVLVCSFDEER
jgi:hypothetical protein